MARELVIPESKAESAVRGAVFDMDGLMFDTEKLFLRFWREASAFYGYNMTVEHVLNIRSLSRKYSVPLLKSLFGEDFPFDKIRKRRIEIMDKYIDENGFEVKRGFLLFLTTSGNTVSRGLLRPLQGVRELSTSLKKSVYRIALSPSSAVT